MKAWKPVRPKGAESRASRSVDPPRPARCKAMFAELSSYLDEQLDDSLCEELEKHLNGCGPCKAFLATLEATIEICRKAPAECSTSEKAAQLRKDLARNYRRAVSALRTGL